MFEITFLIILTPRYQNQEPQLTTLYIFFLFFRTLIPGFFLISPLSFFQTLIHTLVCHLNGFYILPSCQFSYLFVFSFSSIHEFVDFCFRIALDIRFLIEIKVTVVNDSLKSFQDSGCQFKLMLKSNGQILGTSNAWTQTDRNCQMYESVFLRKILLFS